MTKQARKNEIKRLRDEGYSAFQEGRSIHTNPHKYCNQQHWADGWRNAEFEESVALKSEGPQTPEDMQLRIVEWLRAYDGGWSAGEIADMIESGEHLT